MHVEVSEEDGFIACATGKSLIVISEDELNHLPRIVDPVMVSYTACMERLIGSGFILKHKLLSIEF